MRAYEITYSENREINTKVVEADFYQDARELLKKQSKYKMEVLGWKRAYDHENRKNSTTVEKED